MRNKILAIGAILSLAWLAATADICTDSKLGNCQAGGFGVDVASVLASVYADATAVWTFNDPADLGNQDAGSCASCNLTLVNTPTAKGGALGYAAQFDGSTQNAETGTEIQSANTDFSICSWVGIDTVVTNQDWAGSWIAWTTRLAGTTGKQVAFINGTEVSPSDTGLTAGQRAYLCTVFDDDGATTDVYWYLDGSPDGSSLDVAQRMVVGTSGFALATINDATAGRFDGSIGPAYVWATEAATAGNISTLYNSNKGMNCADAFVADATMDHCWDMTEDGGPYLDQIGSVNLTGVNTPTRDAGLV
ncbi:hypothetical protein LCGC14_1719440, partial [marine sediment metagenome]